MTLTTNVFVQKEKLRSPNNCQPTEDELFLHCQRATYVTYIWKSALSPNVDTTDLVGHVWCKVGTETLEIKWMNQKPALDALLEFLSCGCKKSECRNNRCICVANDLNVLTYVVVPCVQILHLMKMIWTRMNC